MPKVSKVKTLKAKIQMTKCSKQNRFESRMWVVWIPFYFILILNIRACFEFRA